MPKIIFITGVCGAGKSSLISHLKNLLPSERFDIRDFDERGVPDNVDRKWRLDETKHWLNTGIINTEKGVSTIISGFSKPDEMQNISSSKDIEVLFCLLDASPGIIRKRLSGRYVTGESQEEIKRVSGDTLEKFIEDNAVYTSALRKLCEDWGCHIIDTDNLSSEEVAVRVTGWIKGVSQ
ncbi:hypothetical protein IID24_05510 [Patescibacteria group bacterium]|nr:hypothetical protein [Patescibacteria group bacterium]